MGEAIQLKYDYNTILMTLNTLSSIPLLSCPVDADDKYIIDTIKCTMDSTQMFEISQLNQVLSTVYETGNYTKDEKTQLSGKYSYIMNPAGRMHVYTEVLDKILEQTSQLTNYVGPNGTIIHQSHNTPFTLVPNTRIFKPIRENIPEKMSDAVKSVIADSLSGISSDIDMTDAFSIHQDEFSQIVDVEIKHERTSSGTYEIQATDLQDDLMRFKRELDQIVFLNVQYNFLSTVQGHGFSWIFSMPSYTKVTEGIDSEGIDKKLDGSRLICTRGQEALLNYGPYRISVISNKNLKILEIPAKYTFDNSTKTFTLTNLVKSNSFLTQQLANTFDITNNEGSNGLHAFYDEWSLDTPVDLEEQTLIKILEDVYNIKSGNIISRVNILKAIDFIFYSWLQKINSVTVVVNTCHYNCHSNNFVDKSNNSCCFCGICTYGLKNAGTGCDS